MSKIVTMTPQVDWVSAEDMCGRVQAAVTELEKEGLMDNLGVFVHDNEVFVGSGGSRVRIRQAKDLVSASVSCDEYVSKRASKIVNELVLMQIKEQAARNRYRVTVTRLEDEKVSVVLER